ncbi:hypothetical protein YC2023_120978 [Brassica napus]
MQYTYGSRLKKVVDWYSCEIVGYHPHLHDFLRTKKLQLDFIAAFCPNKIILGKCHIFVNFKSNSRSNMCFFDIRRDQNLTVVKMDVAWWMEAAPPQIIFPEKPSTCPILETILEERETEEDDHEHEKEDKRGNLDMRYTFFLMIRISELEVLPNHLNQFISDMQALIYHGEYLLLLSRSWWKKTEEQCNSSRGDGNNSSSTTST